MAAASARLAGAQLCTTLAPSQSVQCSSQPKPLAPVARQIGQKHSMPLHCSAPQIRVQTRTSNFLWQANEFEIQHQSQNRHRGCVIKVRAQVAEGGTAEEASVSAKKEFLEDAKSVGSVRLIVNTGLGVLESVTTLQKLFYHEMPGKGLYANVMNGDDNVDFHLLLDKVARVSLVTAQSKRGDFQTYTIRFYDKDSLNGASIFVMWKSGTMGEYADGQVEAFQKLVEKWGEEITFD